MRPEDIITPGNKRSAATSRRVPFTHMGPVDTRIWKAALSLGLMPAQRYEYDVRLAGLNAVQVDPNHELREMWDTLLKKRIDVVAWRDDGPWIVEVKPVASFGALGQCLGYRDMWDREKGNTPAARMACVCAVKDPDLMPTYVRLGVVVVALPDSVAEMVLRPP